MTPRHGASSRRTDPPGPAAPASTLDAVPSGVASGGPHWGSLHGDWQEDVDARSGRSCRGKEPLPCGVLLAVAEHRVRALSMLRQAGEDDPGFALRVDAPQRHARDAQGRNWDIPPVGGRPAEPAAYETDFRRVVDAMRDQFDLA